MGAQLPEPESVDVRKDVSRQVLSPIAAAAAAAVLGSHGHTHVWLAGEWRVVRMYRIPRRYNSSLLESYTLLSYDIIRHFGAKE